MDYALVRGQGHILLYSILISPLYDNHALWRVSFGDFQNQVLIYCRKQRYHITYRCFLSKMDRGQLFLDIRRLRINALYAPSPP